MSDHPPRSQKIIVGIVVLAAVLAGGYFWYSNSGSQDGPTTSAPGVYPGTVRAGHLVALDMAPLFVAKEAGFFKEEGLDLETVFFSNPGDNNAALAGGSIQFSTNPFTLPYLAANSGVPMRIVSAAGGLGVIQIVIQGKHEVEDLAGLAEWVKQHPGQKLKVGSLQGDTLDMICYRAFQRVGLDYDDFEMVWFHDLLAMVQSFENGDIDLLSHIQPYTTSLVVKYNAKVLTDNNEIWGEATPNCTVDVRQDFAEKYPETVKGYLRALRRGFQLIVDDPEKAVDLLSDGNYYKVDREVLLYAFQNQPKRVVLRPNVEGVMTCINDMASMNYIKKPETEVMMLKFLDEIESDPNGTDR